MKIAGILLALTLIGLSFNAAAETEFFKEFKDNYGLLDQDLLKNPGEFASIKDFTYKKDVAEFTFENGTMHILRYVNDRPTTAIFIGKGRAHIEIPSHLEKNNLIWCSGDSVVNENFEVCFIRMADDFDLKLKEIFTFQEEQLDWKNFNIAKKAQGEFFFKPNQDHEYDNYFQLLRSVYERGEDGYFWIDFNRYVFNYDPNRPEQVVISYEHKGGDFMISEAAVFQRQPKGIYDDLQMSEINYAATISNAVGTI